MADSKITALAALTAADPVNDMLPIVDVSDTIMAASGTTKRISVNNILSSSPTASGALTVTGLVTAGSATITGAATVGTTLGVTGVSTLASVGVTGAATVGTTLVVGTNATLTNGNVIIGTSGKGIDFSATASGSGTMTSELLNDYEEGTWSPTIGTIVNLTSVIAYTASYTKVGRLVTITGTVTATVTTANITTYFTLLSIPFANNGTTTGAVQENGNLTIGAIQIASSNLYGFFPAASAITAGAATFNYSVTYRV
jgi:hypothetical protein